MKRSFYLLALCSPLALAAQTTADDTDRDRSKIVAFLEDKLSVDGQDIRIDGFKGFLSSKATLESLRISDDEGVWFTLSDVTLDWERTSLLRGNLIVKSLTAQSITLDRIPAIEGEAATAESTPFSLPDLPVSVYLGELEIAQIAIGPDVLGLDEPVLLSIDGSATLADGAGAADVMITRLGETSGEFILDASYDNGSAVLDLDLSLNEGSGGFISTLIGLPGEPDIALTVQGKGPLDGFVSDIDLATLGQPRLTGQVSLEALANAQDTDPNAPKARRFIADLSGDITPLLEPDYAPFFGTQTALRIDGISYPDGRLTLDELSLDTQALNLQGSVALGADNLPTTFDLTGSIAAKSGEPTLLPLTGDKTFIDNASFIASYDQREGETWEAVSTINGFEQPDLSIESLTLDAGGRIARSRGANASKLLRAVRATLEIETQGMRFGDTNIQSILGSTLTAQTTLGWRDNEPLVLEDFAIAAQDLDLSASGTLLGFDSGFEFNGQIDMAADRLSRLAPLTGLNLSGATQVSVAGKVLPLDGAFDAQISGTGTGLRLGIEKVDALLGSSASFDLEAARDETGLTLRSSNIATNSVKASAQGTYSSTAADLNITASLDDIARLDAGISGPLSLEGTIARSTPTSRWRIDTALLGPEGSQAQMSGSLAPSFDLADLSIRGSAPLGLANTFTTATLLQGNVLLDLGLSGPLELSSVTGTIRTSAASKALVPAADLSFALERGIVTLNGTSATIDALTRSETGGAITTTGTLGLSGAFPADLTARIVGLKLSEDNLYSTKIGGTLALTGPVLSRPQLTGIINVDETNISVNPVALGAGGDILDITHIGETSAQRATRSRAGVIVEGEDGGSALSLGMDVTVSAPSQIYIRGRGLDAELGGSIRLTGNSSNIVPVGEFSLIRGRLSILGKRIDIAEGRLSLQGDFDPNFSLIATTQTDDIDIQVITSGSLSDPQITFSSSPELPEDEVLAQLLFSKSITDISILQAAQLAAAIKTLTGGGGGLTDTIRGKLGVDDIDLSTTDDGDTALKLGKYLSDEIYTDVTIDSTGKSEINLNLDATDNITFKGSASTDGDTGLGVFFEKEY